MASAAPAPTTPPAPLGLAARSTALLLMDFQPAILRMLPAERPPDEAVAAAARLLAAARAACLTVIHVRVCFRAGHPEVGAASNNVSFARARANGALLESDAATGFDARVAPREGEPVVTKRRAGPFAGTELALLLRAAGATTIVVAGVSTSGCVLSCVRQAADDDMRIVVARDACADADAEVHAVLMGKVFVRQASVVSADEAAAAMAAAAAAAEAAQ